MTWKYVNIANTGTSIKYGADDLDKFGRLFSGVDVDDVDINADWTFRNGKLNLRNPANTFSYNIVSAAIAANRTINLPLLTGTDTFAVLSLGQTFSNKTLDATCDISAASGAATGSQSYTYLLYNDAGTYKARNGTTGAISYSGTDVAAVLASIFNSVSTTTQLFIQVGPGDFTMKSWGATNFRHSNFTIRGAGPGITNFIVHNDTWDVAGESKVFAFEANETQYTSISLQSNAAVDSFAVLTNATTDLTVGCHVMLGSNAALAGSAKAGEHNRVVAIIATGGSPSQRIILEKSTRYAYNTADSAIIRRVDFLENINLEGFTIKSNQDFDHIISFMNLDFAYDAYVNNIQFKDWGIWNGGGFHNCFITNVCVNSNFQSLNFEQSPERGDSTGQNAVGYAVSCRSGCETVYYRNCNFKGQIRHCFTTTANTAAMFYGTPRNIWIMNCNAESTDEACFDTHAEGKGIHFVNCSVNSARSGSGSDTAAGTDDTDAFNSRSSDTEFINCSVMNCRGTGFSCDAGLTGIKIQNCTVKSLTLSRNGIIVGAAGTVVTGNLVDGSAQDGIELNADDCIISNNRLINNTGSGMDVNNADNCIISGNVFKSNGAYGVDFSSGDCQNNILTGNQFASNATAAVLNGDQVGNVEVNNVGYGSSAAKISSTSGAVLDINTTASETDMLNYSVPANALGANGCVRFTLTGYLLQNQATGTSYTFAVKFGGTTMYAETGPTLAQSATKQPFRLVGEIGNNNSTASQSCQVFFLLNDTTAANTGIGDLVDDEMVSNAIGGSEGADTTKDTTAAQTLQVTVTMSVSNSATHTVVKRKIVEVMKSA